MAEVAHMDLAGWRLFSLYNHHFAHTLHLSYKQTLYSNRIVERFDSRLKLRLRVSILTKIPTTCTLKADSMDSELTRDSLRHERSERYPNCRVVVPP